jgi:hypothetical protein
VEIRAEDYEKILRKGYTGEEVIAGLSEISALLRTRMEVFLVGEAPIVLRGWKNTCAEVEIVFLSDKDVQAFVEALRKADYEETLYMRYKKYLAIDLHVKSFSEYIITEEMLKRAFDTDLGNLRLKIASPEDVILLKSSSTRDTDYVDTRLLLNKIRPDWSVVVAELDNQVNRHGTSDYAAIMLLATVNDLRRRKYQIPDSAPRDIIKAIQKDIRPPQAAAQA